jgi:hypothetical protein
MVEVFKTNVTCTEQAILLVERIQKTFPHYQVNFDLDDCDRILRVKSISGNVQTTLLIDFLNTIGYTAEVLQDELKQIL